VRPIGGIQRQRFAGDELGVGDRLVRPAVCATPGQVENFAEAEAVVNLVVDLVENDRLIMTVERQGQLAERVAFEFEHLADPALRRGVGVDQQRCLVSYTARCHDVRPSVVVQGQGQHRVLRDPRHGDSRRLPRAARRARIDSQFLALAAGGGVGDDGDDPRVVNGDGRPSQHAAPIDALNLPRRAVAPGVEEAVAAVDEVGAAVRVEGHARHALAGQGDARRGRLAAPDGQGDGWYTRFVCCSGGG